MSDPGTLALLLLLGTWAALDGTAVAQVMISRPLVSGTLAGWILGDPVTGLIVGGILEAAHLGELPAGGSRLPEPGPAAVPAVAAAVQLGGPGGIAAGLALGAALSLLGGATVIGQRRLNGRMTLGIEEKGAAARTVAIRHWGCIALDALRGCLVTGGGLVLAAAVVAWIGNSPGGVREFDPGGGGWPGGGLGAGEFGPGVLLPVLLLPGALAAGALLRGWSPSLRRAAFFVAGVVGGVVAGVLIAGATS